MPMFTIQRYATLQQWLSENGELCVDVYLPKSAGGGRQYFVRSVEDLEALIASETWRELVVTIFRRLQYPLRGVADNSLLERSLKMISEGEWYTIVLLENYFYPSEPRWPGSGNSHAEFRQEFSEVIGHRVGVGQNPFDKDDTWISKTSDEAMVLYFKRDGDHYEMEAEGSNDAASHHP
jgi:hypothetical protein